MYSDTVDRADCK